MIKPAALILAAAMGAVSAGTYYGLDLLPPGAIPEPLGRAQKPEPPKPGTHAASAPTQTAAAAPAQPAPAPAPAEQPVTEQDLAEEPPPPAEPPAEQPAAQAQAEPAPAAAPEPAAPAPEPQPQPQPAKAEPAPAEAPPAAKPAPKKRAPVTVVREEEPAARQEVASASAPSTPVKPRPPEADVIKPWWPDSSKMPANQLKLQYAGQVQGEQAIALLFSAPLNVDSLRQHAQVKTGTGEAVKGGWELGKNPRLAVFRGVGSGRYTVILAPQVADTKGFMLGQTLQGPVYIQPPQ